MEMSIRFPGLGLVFDYVPRSFQIFGMEFTIYGVLIAVGALLGMGLVTLEAKRNGEDQNRYLDMMLISLLVSVAGCFGRTADWCYCDAERRYARHGDRYKRKILAVR